MKVDLAQTPQVRLHTPQQQKSNASFDAVVRQLAGKEDYHSQIVQLEQAMLAGRSLKPNELLMHQIRAQQFHLKVELASKAAESLLTTVRKLQSPQ
ncbi:MAG: hypothetical protein KDD62_13565 [Bdellovibrionales bacterium]|nr:hypothetical protein [Bdellovibrionales bacterium]